MLIIVMLVVSTVRASMVESHCALRRAQPLASESNDVALQHSGSVLEYECNFSPRQNGNAVFIATWDRASVPAGAAAAKLPMEPAAALCTLDLQVSLLLARVEHMQMSY